MRTTSSPGGVPPSPIYRLRNGPRALNTPDPEYSEEARKAKYFEAAQKYIQKQNFAAARLELQNAVRIDPKWAEAQYQLGKVTLQLQDYPRAYAAFKAAVEAQPSHFDAQVEFASLLLAGRAFDEARDHAQAALDLKPDNSRAGEILAYAYAGLGDLESSEKELETVVSQDPSAMTAALNLVRLKVRKRDLPAAEEVLKRAAQQPAGISALVSLGNFYTVTGRNQDAENAYREALKREPKSTAAQYPLARLMLLTDRMPAAEQIYRTIAASAEKPGDRGAFARFLMGTGQMDKGITELEQIVKRYPDDRLNRGLLATAYVQSGKSNQAIALVDDLLKKNSKDQEALLVRARINLTVSKPQEAAADLREVIRVQPDSSAAHFYLGLALQAQGANNEAIQELGEALRRRPANLEARVALAQMHLEKGAYKTAMDLIDGAPSPQDKMPGIRVMRAAALGGTGDLAGAEKALRDITVKSPRFGLAFRWLGAVQASQKDYEKAKASLERALAIDPRDAASVQSLARVYVAQNKIADGQKRIQKIVTEHPDFGAAAAALALLQVRAGAPDSAQATLQERLKAQPDDLKATLVMADLQASRGDMKTGEGLYRQALQKKPRDPDLLAKLGMVMEQQKRTKEAIDFYRQALMQNNDHVVASNNLACLLADSGGDLNEALKLAQSAKERMPKDPNIADTLGWVYYKKANYSLAQSEFQQALRASPKSPLFLYHLAECQAMQGNNAAALQGLRQALAANQPFTGIERAKELLKKLETR